MTEPEGREPSLGKLADLEMLVMTAGGRQRTEAGYHALFGRVGLRLTRIVPSAGMAVSSRRLDVSTRSLWMMKFCNVPVRERRGCAAAL